MAEKLAFFFDYDGTLVDERVGIYKPLPSTVNAVKELKKMGHTAALCTGRSQCYVPDTGIDFDCYITANGAYSTIHGKTAVNETIAAELMERIIASLDKNGLIYWLETAQKCYTKAIGTPLFNKITDIFKINTEVFEEYSPLVIDKINKLNVIYENKVQLHSFLSEFDGLFDATGVHGQNLVDISMKNINKGFGLAHTAKALGIPLKNTVAFGDGDNDFSMLERAGRRIAMLEHSPSLDILSPELADSVENDGAAKKIMEILQTS